MLRVTLNITLILEGPILTKSSSPGNYGVDTSMAMNHEDKYSIPGTLVKGKLREALNEFACITSSYISKKEIKYLLGKKSGNIEDGEPVDPYRGLLKFSDFVSEKEANKTFHRIRMNEETGTVKKGALLIMETPFAAGEKVCFHGTINFITAEESEANKIRDYVEKGLRWISGFGSEQTVGFGKTVNVAISVDINNIQLTQADDSLVEAEKLGLVIIPRAPFCISKRRIRDNLFESEKFIPGGVIKGCVASMWAQLVNNGKETEINKDFDQDRKELCRHFDKIRFTHAFPARAYSFKRPIYPPLSLIKFKDEPYCDAALCDKPFLVVKKEKYKSPAFSIDWKDSSDVDKDFGWEEPERDLRVRTAIDSNKRRADENQLFAYETVIPAGFHWLGWIDLGLVDENDRQAVNKQLRGLLAYGLERLGKTKASANVEIKDSSDIQSVYSSKFESLDGQYIITLQTPAILCNPEKLNETSNRDALENAYRMVWDELSDSSLSLVRYFARQTLEGGYYLQRKFQTKDSYEPYLLTEAGSVFVFNINDEKAREKVEDWANHGLPLPRWTMKKYGMRNHPSDYWSSCPYIRENGYGEIAVNLCIHTAKIPEKRLKSCYIYYINQD